MAGEWLAGKDFQWLEPTRPDNTFLHGMELGLRMKHQQQQYALAVREAESKAKLMDSTIRLRESQIFGQEQAAEGFAALGQVLSETAGKWTEPESKAKFWGVAAKYPHVQKSPAFKELVDNFQLADNAELKKQLLDSQIGGRSELETQKFENRQSLLGEKYDRLAELQEDSQEARTIRDEIQHLYRLEENEKKPRGVGQFHDLKSVDQAAMNAELAVITRNPFNMKPEEKAKRIEGVYRKYKAIAAANQPVATAPTAKILKFNPASGKFE